MSNLQSMRTTVLPPRILSVRKPGDARGIKHLVHDETPIAVKLGELQPLRIEVMTSK